MLRTEHPFLQTPFLQIEVDASSSAPRILYFEVASRAVFDSTPLSFLISQISSSFSFKPDSVYFQNNLQVFDNGDKEYVQLRRCLHRATDADFDSTFDALDLIPGDIIWLFAASGQQPKPFSHTEVIAEQLLPSISHPLTLELPLKSLSDVQPSALTLAAYSVITRKANSYIVPDDFNFEEEIGSESDNTFVLRLKVDSRKETLQSLTSRLQTFLVACPALDSLVVKLSGSTLRHPDELLTHDDRVRFGSLSISTNPYQLHLLYRDQHIKTVVASSYSGFEHLKVSQLPRMACKYFRIVKPPSRFKFGQQILSEGTLVSNGIKPGSSILCFDPIHPDNEKETEERPFQSIVSHTLYRHKFTNKVSTRFELLADCDCMFRTLAMPLYRPSMAVPSSSSSSLMTASPSSSPQASTRRKQSSSILRLNEKRKKSSPDSSSSAFHLVHPSSASMISQPISRADDSSWRCSCLDDQVRMSQDAYNRYAVCEACHIAVDCRDDLLRTGVDTEDGTEQGGGDFSTVVCPKCGAVVRQHKRLCYFTPFSLSESYEETAKTNRANKSLQSDDPSSNALLKMQARLMGSHSADDDSVSSSFAQHPTSNMNTLFAGRLTAFRLGFVAHFRDKASSLLTEPEAAGLAKLAVEGIDYAFAIKEKRQPSDNNVFCFIFGSFLAAAQILAKPLTYIQLQKVKLLYTGAWDNQTMAAADNVLRSEHTREDSVIAYARELLPFLTTVHQNTSLDASSSSSSSSASHKISSTSTTSEATALDNLCAQMCDLLKQLNNSSYCDSFSSYLQLPPEKGGYFTDSLGMMTSLGLVHPSVFSEQASKVAGALLLIFGGYKITASKIAQLIDLGASRTSKRAASLHKFLTPAALLQVTSSLPRRNNNNKQKSSD